MKRLYLGIAFALLATSAQADQVINQDLVVDGNACIGVDCVTGDANGSSDLRLKSTTPELYFDDTSVTPGFDLDWFISKSVDNLRVRSADQTVFFEFASNGNFGIGTSSPGLDLHIQNGDTPAIRLLQDLTNGNPIKTWDIGANDTNFFVRDLDAGTLPFRIRPGAPQNAIYVDTNGQVGMGLQNPRGALHVRRNQPNNVPHLVLQTRREGGRTEIWFEDRDTPTDDDALRLQLRGDDFNITFNGTGGPEFRVSKTGDVRIFRGDLVIPNGGVIVGGSTLNVPDYVFADDYELMPLSDVAAFVDAHSHLPHIPSAAAIAANGLDLTDMQLAMLKTIEEMSLHMFEMRAEIDHLKAQLAQK